MQTNKDLHNAIAMIMQDHMVVSIIIHYPDGGLIFSRPAEDNVSTYSEHISDIPKTTGKTTPSPKPKPEPEKVCFPIGSPRCK